MNEAHTESGKTRDDTFVPVRLATRNDLPRRARTLLGAVLELCRNALGDTLNRTLDEFAQHLFKLSEASRNSDAQHNYFVSSRELHKTRSQILPRFFDVLEDFLAGYDERARSAAAAAPLARREGLSLVETGELEESLALQEFVARAEVRHSPALYSLGHRFAVLVALPALDAQALPIGPAQLGRALRHAGAILAVSAEHRVLLYRLFDKLAAKDLIALYDALNAYFVEQHILKHLRAQLVRSKRAPRNGASAQAAGANAETEPGAGAASAESDAASAEAAHASASAFASPPRSAAARRWHGNSGHAPADSSSASAWGDPQSLADARDMEVFATLRELMAGSRATSPTARALAAAGDSVPAGAFVPSIEDVQGVLGALQSKPAAPIAADGTPRLRRIDELKQDLLQQLRELSPTHERPHLAGEDSDTIDLVGMLFDQMVGSVGGRPSTQQLLTRLQVPLLRVALRDKSFFTRKTHPARQLLNAVAETAERWMEGSDSAADAELQHTLELLLDRLATEFDGDLGVIEELLGDLDDHVQTMTRKAEVAERRQVDATIGREKLALAREAAANAMARRVLANPPTSFVKTLLEQAWADVLALTLLRQGESSPAYRKRIDVADRLIESSIAAQQGEAAAPPTEDLREEIEAGLSQIGYHAEDIQAVVRRLFVAEGAANEASIDEERLTEGLVSKQRLGGEDKAVEEKPLAAAAQRRESLHLTAAELDTLEQLKQLPFGTWFEFVTNQQGDRVRKKMAWASKLTGRCMFVNQRGARTDDTTLEELAREVTRGQAFVAPNEPDSFVDRAWGAIVSSLKRLSSLASAFAPPPAEPIE